MTRIRPKQTRRSISIRGATYDRLREHCDDTSTTMSAIIEQILADYFTARGLPVPEHADTQQSKGGKALLAKFGRQYFVQMAKKATVKATIVEPIAVSKPSDGRPSGLRVPVTKNIVHPLDRGRDGFAKF